MVERSVYLDGLFHSLADSVRRDILSRLARAAATVGEIARHYEISLAAVAKHLKVLEASGLVTKQRRGKEQVVSISPRAFQDASDYLARYEALWNVRLDALEAVLNEEGDEE
jgi:DNA-binding transcriptional ArsR family regulator